MKKWYNILKNIKTLLIPMLIKNKYKNIKLKNFVKYIYKIILECYNIKNIYNQKIGINIMQQFNILLNKKIIIYTIIITIKQLKK